MIAAAKGKVDFIVYQLVTSEDDRGLDLPHKEVIGRWEVSRYVFFHGEIEGWDVVVGVREMDVYHSSE